MTVTEILRIVGLRTFWRAETLDFVPPSGDASWVESDEREARRYVPATGWQTVPADANLVSSRMDEEGKMHMPVIDIDFSTKLVPSTTEGHFHLYLDKAMDWKTYERLLKALADAGIIERGYYKASKARKATYVRIPGTTKADTYLPSQATPPPGGWGSTRPY
jgi:hypothetical protein